jgi:5-methylcytosine-specific restriction endonuclease McrA
MAESIAVQEIGEGASGSASATDHSRPRPPNWYQKLSDSRRRVVIARSAKWRRNNPQRELSMARIRGRRYLARRRITLLELLGAFCRFCGETDDAVLVFDHIIPVGHKARGVRAGSDLLCLMRRGLLSPFSIQVLCANCHARKTRMEFTGPKPPAIVWKSW